MLFTNIGAAIPSRQTAVCGQEARMCFSFPESRSPEEEKASCYYPSRWEPAAPEPTPKPPHADGVRAGAAVMVAVGQWGQWGPWGGSGVVEWQWGCGVAVGAMGGQWGLWGGVGSWGGSGGRDKAGDGWRCDGGRGGGEPAPATDQMRATPLRASPSCQIPHICCLWSQTGLLLRENYGGNTRILLRG